MLKIIVATEADGLDTRTFVLGVEIEDENLDIEQAVKNACKEYCLTEEGRKTYEGNCNSFNWGDLDAYVPNEICERHGFKKVWLRIAGEYNFDQQLVDETDIFPEEDDDPKQTVDAVNTVFGVKIDEDNTCYIVEFNDVEQALKECLSVSYDVEDAWTVCDHANENMSGNKTYIVRLKNDK